MICEVDHEARIQKGLLRCYNCEKALQSIAAANAIRERLGRTHCFDRLGVLRPDTKVCPMCRGVGRIHQERARE